MNTVTEIVNTFAGLWAGQMWTIIWQSSVLVGLIVIVTLLFRRLSAAVKFWLWMLVPLRLLVMPLITISLPLLPAIAPPHIEHVGTSPAIVEPAVVEYSPTMMENFSIPDEASNFTPIQPRPIEIQEPKAEPDVIRIKPSLWSFIMIAWFLGISFWTMRLFWSWRKIRCIVSNAIKVEQKRVFEQASNAAVIVGLKKIPEILVTRENISPFLFGILRPVLIIPSGFVNNVNDEGLLAVFSHEFAHLRRRDTLIGWILAICETFYFFHPVLHFAKRRILFERERACDDWVIASGNSHKKTYANALIDAAGICRNFSASLGPTGVVAESFGDLKKRIIAIGSNLKPKTRLSKTAFVVLILIGTICVPGFVLTNKTIAASEKATLETVRKLVAHNEALINPIKMEYSITYEHDEGYIEFVASLPETVSRNELPTGTEYIWALDGKKYFSKRSYISDSNESGSEIICVFDLDKGISTASIQSLNQGIIDALNYSDGFEDIRIAELGIGPFVGQYKLSEVLVDDYATLYEKTEMVNGRETYVLDAGLPPHSEKFVRIWIDKERGMPLRIWHYDKHPAWSDQEPTLEVNDIELYQLPNGAWIPIKAVEKKKFFSFFNYEHFSVNIDSITTKREDIPESLFEIDFPEGTLFANLITGFISIKGKPSKTYEQIVEQDGSFIAGTVVDLNDVPVPGVVVRPIGELTELSDGGTRAQFLDNNEVNCAVTDTKGRFAIELEHDWLYDIDFYPEEFADQIVRNTPLGKHDLKVTLEKGGTVTGRVVRFENGKKVPVANIEVTAKGGTLARSNRFKTMTDSQGRFQLRNLSIKSLTRNPNEQLQQQPQTWNISCGPESQTVVFEEGKSTKEVEIILRPELSSAIPLTGKSLPSFDGIKLDYDINQAKDKKVLVCFFDLEQRPARNGILQLNKRIQELEEKGVKVIAIHVSNIEKNTLDAWLKENNITIPVGIVEGDSEQIRFKWAVQSLPWLILTDTEHIVTDEGFDIETLSNIESENEMKEIVSEKSESQEHTSQAWNILRQVDTQSLMVGLPQRLGKAVMSEERQTPTWQGVNSGGSIELDIKVEGEKTGEIFVGFFINSRWWLEPPKQVRVFPGPGTYKVDRLIPGKYYIGAMIGSLPVPDTLGVDNFWPESVQIEPGKSIKVKLLLSDKFQSAPFVGQTGVDVGYAGQYDITNPEQLITLQTLDENGDPAPFCRVVFVDRISSNPSQVNLFHDSGTDENGYAYYDKFSGPFTFNVQRFDFIPENFVQRYQYMRLEDLHYTKDQKVITFKWPAFPTGTGKVKGRIHNQHQKPLTEYYLTITHDIKGSAQSTEDNYSIGYKIPITNHEGTFEVDDLPSGKYTVMVRAFDYPTYVRDFNMGEFTITDEPDSTTEFVLEVEAKELLYGKAFYQDGSPLDRGTWMALFEEYTPEQRQMYPGQRGRYFSYRMDPDGFFRVTLSKKEREDLIQCTGGNIEISDSSGTIGQIHIDKLSKDREQAPSLYFPRGKPKDSLIGLSLPDFNNIKTDFDLNQIEDKKVLICFFDMEQRPSRNSLLQLNKRIQDYKKKGITVLAVHTSKIDNKVIEEWMKENDISLTVGMVESENEQTLYNWGIKSLPWLILTNTEHIVTAEGFTIDELNKKIETISGNTKSLPTTPVSKKSTESDNNELSIETRIVKFPQDQTLGILYTRDKNIKDQKEWDNWEELGQAQGEITISQDKELRLDIFDGNYKNISSVKSLKSSDIQFIYISCGSLKDSDLEYFKGLTDLEYLTISSGSSSRIAPFNGEGLINLKGMTSLRYLRIMFTRIDDESLKHLQYLTNLKELALSHTDQIHGEGLVYLKDLPSLRSISLSGTQIEGSGLKHLQDMNQLEYLNLDTTKITNEDLVYLKGLTGLKSFPLPSGTTDADLANLKELKMLEQLNLSDTKVTENGLIYLKNMSGLKTLYLSGQQLTEQSSKYLLNMPQLQNITILDVEDGSGLKQLRNMPWLKSISIADIKNDECMKALKGLTAVTQLQISDSDVSDTGLANIEGLTSLEILNMKNLLITDTGMKYLKGLTSLKDLNLDGTLITDNGLANLQNMVSLGSLSIRYTNITDKGLEYLKGLKSLHTLSLSDTKITDVGFVNLKGLNSLYRLILSNLNITGDGVAYLKELQSLRELTLRVHHVINAAGLENLKEMTSLHELNLGTGSISNQNLADLRKALPDCAINIQEPFSNPPKRKIPEPSSLISKTLPELKNFNVELSKDDIHDKKMLICFFDMEQRPSRNCVLQLSKRTDDLAQQGISVIAVHASNIEKNTLDTWLKENNITIPVGIVAGDSEQIRFYWAIQSLPWLILTDNQHVVTNEGFDIETLSNIESENETQDLISEMPGSKEQSSLVWYILRQWNDAPLLLGMPQRLGKVVENSQQSDEVWTGIDNGGSLKLDITVEDDVQGDIFIGLFKDAKWSVEPVQVRKYPGQGKFVMENIPPGKYQVGAMLGSLPKPIALGVQQNWPEYLEIKAGQETSTKVLVSVDFRKRSSGWYNDEVSRDFVGDWKDMDNENLLEGRLIGPNGKEISFGEIMIREFNTNPRRGIAAPNRGTNEKGYYKYDGMKWPYKVLPIWKDLMPSVLGYRYQQIHYNKVFEGKQTVNFNFEEFPTGTAKLIGKVSDQNGDPLSEFFIKVITESNSHSQEIWNNPDEKYYLDIGYQQAFISEDGSFEMDNLPSGDFTVRVVPFDIQAYQLESGENVVFESGKTANVDLKVTSKNIFYGRVLFPDGSPAVVKPEPWLGAKTRILLPMGGRARGVGELDNEGYFSVQLSDSEIESMKSGTNKFVINIPLSEENQSSTVGRFSIDKLSKNKNNIEPIEIEWSELPRKSLLNSALPAFDGINIDFDINQAKDKKVLVCFFDLEQRPARNSILQLSKRVYDLAQEEISVIAVHASKIEKNTLDTWLKENNITMPVGIVESNSEQIGFNWAIQSLPWLILTDTEHIVTDEGFSIDELDEKINKSSAVSTSGIISPSLLLSTDNKSNQTVRGVVKNRNGQAISGAKVYLYHKISNWDFENRIDQQVTSSNDSSFKFDRPLKYNNINEYPKGSDTFVLIATHPDYALGWCDIVKEQKKESYELVLTEPQTQTIIVTDHEGNPLSGAKVWAYNIGNPSGPEPLFRETLALYTNVGIAEGITEEDGRATVTNLPKTNCSFHASLKGYATGLAFSGQRRIRLSKGATVRGSVLDEDGKPVENALVKFHTNWGMWQFFLAKTDSQGQFVLEDIPADGWDMSPWGADENANGSYIITVEHDDYISSENQDVLMPGDVKENFIIDVYHGTLIKCNVVEAGTNKPLAGVRVQGSNESGRIDGRSDADGVFTFRVIPGNVSLFSNSPPEGLYFLRDKSSSGSSIRFEAQGEEMTVTLETPKIAGELTIVKGKVILPDGSPAANVKLSTTNSGMYESASFSGAGGAYTGTNPDGSFELKEVPVGMKLFIYGHTRDYKYVLSEIIEELENPTELSQPLVMKEGQVADVLFTNEQGEPLINFPLGIMPKMWGNDVFRAEEHHGRTDAQGHLKINGVIPGMEYFIMDSRGNRSTSNWPELYFHDTKVLIPEDGQPVEIRTTAPAVEIMKEDISGFVEDQDGNPIENASVSLLNKELVLLPNPMKIGDQTHRVITDNYLTQTRNDGYFRLADLIPGRTDIVVKADSYQTKFLNNISTDTSGLKVVLDDPAAYKLSGRVVDIEGNPIKDVQITLARDIDKPVATTVKTNNNGVFEFDDVLEPIAEINTQLLFAQKEGFAIWGKFMDTTGGESYVVITLLPEETVTGRVVDDAGNPISGAKATLSMCRGDDGSFSFTRWQNIAPSVKTDTDGQFIFPGLPTKSSVSFIASAEGFVSGYLRSININYDGGYAIRTKEGMTTVMVTKDINETEGGLEFVLHKGLILRGTVTYEDTGQPVTGLRLATQTHEGSKFAEELTDESGQFEIKGVDPSTTSLFALFDDEFDEIPEWTAAAVTFDDLKPDQVKENIKLVFVKGCIVSGKVTDYEGNPLQDIKVIFHSAARPPTGGAFQSISTAEDGTWKYRFPPGKVYIYLQNIINNVPYTLDVKDGQEITDIDFEMPREVPGRFSFR
ncbi:MAG: carboxypeptidase regulatory-like domain-containing protein [Sedimentisphaerales bacterium]|nr:carboxypeptidase regulatory-like domain-containing protein [Sedimentisphaerales bacterium]